MTIALNATVTSVVAGATTVTQAYTPDAAASAVFVGVYRAGANDLTTGITYGGVSMAELAGLPILGSSTEFASLSIYAIYNADIASGTQNVVVTNSNTNSQLYVIWSYTADGDVSIQAIDLDIAGTAEAANPSGTIALGGNTCAVSMLFMTGKAAVTDYTPTSGWSSSFEYDAGGQCVGMYTYDTIASTDVTYGWTQTTDDAMAVAIAIKETASGVTGTGSLTTASETISGTGVIGHTGTGALTTSDVTLSGSGVITHKGTGSLTTSEATLSGDGTVTGVGEQTGTGALTLDAVTASGSGVITHKGTGTLTTSDATLSGVGVLTHNGTGTLTTSEATLDGTGTVVGEITGTGALTTGEVTVSGYDVLPVAEKPSGGGGTSTSVVSGRRRKQKLILVERVEDVEELLEQIDEIVEQSPKTKAKAKVVKPTQTVQEAPQAAFDWLAYYDAQLSRLRDQQRANSLRLQLDRNAELIRAIIDGQQNAQQQAQMLQMQQDEEDLLLLLMAA